MLDTGCSILDALARRRPRYSLLDAGCSILDVRYWMFVPLLLLDVRFSISCSCSNLVLVLVLKPRARPPPRPRRRPRPRGVCSAHGDQVANAPRSQLLSSSERYLILLAFPEP